MAIKNHTPLFDLRILIFFQSRQQDKPTKSGATGEAITAGISGEFAALASESLSEAASTDIRATGVHNIITR